MNLLALRQLSISAAFFIVTQALAQAPAPVSVDGAWARASVQGQMATGAFMKLTAREPLRLVGASTPAAGVTEIHEMKMENDVMKMRAVAGVDLVPGKAFELRPGAHHVMLMDLKAPLAKGSTIPLTLRLRKADGQELRLELQVPVTTGAPSSHMH